MYLLSTDKGNWPGRITRANILGSTHFTRWWMIWSNGQLVQWSAQVKFVTLTILLCEYLRSEDLEATPHTGGPPVVHHLLHHGPGLLSCGSFIQAKVEVSGTQASQLCHIEHWVVLAHYIGLPMWTMIRNRCNLKFSEKKCSQIVFYQN